MNNKVLPFVMGLCVLGIFVIIFVGITGSKEQVDSSKSVTNEVVVVATTSEQLSEKVALSYGEFTFEPLEADNYLVETSATVSDARPFTDMTLLFSLSAGSYFGTQESDFTGSRIVFDRKSGDFVLMYEDMARGTSSVATIYSRTDYENLENDLKVISIGKRFSFETDEEFKTRSEVVKKYCHAVENTSTPTKRYNLLTTDEFDALPQAEQMEYGPFICDAGQYYIFDSFIVKAHFASDGVRVSDVKSK